jgi:hypothetical protein
MANHQQHSRGDEDRADPRGGKKAVCDVPLYKEPFAEAQTRRLSWRDLKTLRQDYPHKLAHSHFHTAQIACLHCTFDIAMRGRRHNVNSGSRVPSLIRASRHEEELRLATRPKFFLGEALDAERRH